jgi:hypothetical protein
MALHAAGRYIDGILSYSEASNSPRTSEVNNGHDGLKVERTGNSLLNKIEDRAINAIMERRKAAPPSPASVSILRMIWATELKLEIGAQMVRDVREDIKARYNGCSVCYLIIGNEDMDHTSGTGCKTLPLEESTDGWVDFKKQLKFPPGVLCWNCLLPTVRIVFFLFNHILNLRQKQNTKTNAAGAEYHAARDCRHPHFIRPVLFAFFQYADQKLKDFVKINLGVCAWDNGMDAYREWLTSSPGNDASNLVKLYWWILMFWGRLPR